MKTSEVLIAGAVVIGVIGVVYYITQRPAAAGTTNIYNQPKRDNAWSLAAVVVQSARDVGLKALNSGGGQRTPTADTPASAPASGGSDYQLTLGPAFRS